MEGKRKESYEPWLTREKKNMTHKQEGDEDDGGKKECSGQEIR